MMPRITVASRRLRLLLGAALVACAVAVPLWAYDAFAPARVVARGPRLPSATELGFVAAEIYFVQWEVTTAVAIPLERLRSPSLRREVVHDWRRLDDMLARLRPEQLHVDPKAPQSLLGDYRLLVVFKRADGSEVSYAADYNRLLNPATLAWRPIDADFRAAFSPGKW
jgi:hypothetical protein